MGDDRIAGRNSIALSAPTHDGHNGEQVRSSQKCSPRCSTRRISRRGNAWEGTPLYAFITLAGYDNSAQFLGTLVAYLNDQVVRRDILMPGANERMVFALAHNPPPRAGQPPCTGTQGALSR